MLEIARVQHAVGQGGFHTGEIRENLLLRHRYVYDCGAMDQYATIRDARIDVHLSDCGRRAPLHTLFLSHLHADHVNGVKRLLDKASGLDVDTIVLPLVDVTDRLIAYARTVVHDAASAGDPLYRSLIVSPAAALSLFEPRQIIFVEASDGDGDPGGRDPDGDDGSPDPDGSAADIAGRRDESGRPAWVLVGRGTPRLDDPQVAPDPPNGVRTIVIQDTMALATPGGTAEWLLAPYVDTGVSAGRSTFLNVLSGELDVPRPQILGWLANVANLEWLLLERIDALKKAYSAIEPDANVTSLCLYSGPRHRPAAMVEHETRCGGLQIRSLGIGAPCAWLATGDAALKDDARRAAFIRRYRGLLGQVVTLTLPHHGSDRNFHVDLLDEVRPDLCVVPADAFKDWNHPGVRTVQGVCSRGMVLQVVGSASPGGVDDRVTIG